MRVIPLISYEQLLREGTAAYEQLTSFHRVVRQVEPHMSVINLELAVGYTHAFLTEVDPDAAALLPLPVSLQTADSPTDTAMCVYAFAA